MEFYFAPFEGITGYLYRNAFAHRFGGVEKYFTPFLAPHEDKDFNSREKNDILPEDNEGLLIVPQILTNKPEQFLRVARALWELGYREVNLNLGCPSPTVVNRGRGAGLLAEPDKLDALLYGITEGLSQMEGMTLSVKTRIGMESAEEFGPLLDIWNRYPLRELIVHARVREDYYGGEPDVEAYRQALSMSRCPVCYNGDIFSKEALEQLCRSVPQTGRVMLGRGLLANPGLARELRDGEAMTREEFLKFHEEVLSGYLAMQLGDRNTLFKMKELWSYMIHLFPDSEKYDKKIRKAERVGDYRAAVTELLGNRKIDTQRGFKPQNNWKRKRRNGA